jgi:hypothetical protein
MSPRSGAPYIPSPCVTRALGSSSAAAAVVTLTANDYSYNAILTNSGSASGSQSATGRQSVASQSFTPLSDTMKISLSRSTLLGKAVNDLTIDYVQVTRTTEGVPFTTWSIGSFQLTDFLSGKFSSIESSGGFTGSYSPSITTKAVGGTFTQKEVTPGYGNANAAMQASLNMVVPTTATQTSDYSSVGVTISPKLGLLASPLVLQTAVKSINNQNCLLVTTYGGKTYNAMMLNGCSNKWQSFQSLSFNILPNLGSYNSVCLEVRCHGPGNQATV